MKFSKLQCFSQILVKIELFTFFWSDPGKTEILTRTRRPGGVQANLMILKHPPGVFREIA